MHQEDGRDSSHDDQVQVPANFLKSFDQNQIQKVINLQDAYPVEFSRHQYMTWNFYKLQQREKMCAQKNSSKNHINKNVDFTRFDMKQPAYKENSNFIGGKCELLDIM